MKSNAQIESIQSYYYQECKTLCNHYIVSIV
jgi:hypothetical protein